MELEKEKLLNETYQKFMEIGLNSPETFDILDEIAATDLMGFGTAMDERIFSITDLKALIDNQRQQSQGLEIRWTIKPVLRKVLKDESSGVFVDEIELEVTKDNDVIRMSLRYTIVLEYLKDKWVVVHFHGSKPELVESEKDTWGIETWKEKAEELEKQVTERTADLVQKNRDLEIETALEKIRSRSMAMHHTEELKEVIQVVFDQFVGLNIPVEHAGFILNYKEREDMHIWLADRQQGVPTEITIPYFDSPHWNSYLEAKASYESFFTNLLTFKEKNKFYQDLFKLIPTLTEEAQQSIFSKPALAISTVLLDNVGLYIEHYSETPFTAEENAVLRRFGKVFQQSYTRFLDLQKSEDQAREAQIELALEKVRSRTMGMQSSDELPEVANLMFIEVQALGIPAWSCGYCIELEDGKSGNCIMSSEGTLQKPFLLPYYGEESFDKWNEFIHSEHTFFTQELSGTAIDSHYDFMKSLPQLEPVFHELAEAGLSLPSYQINHLCKFNYGFLLFITYESVPDAHDVFRRFTKVFDQTYTRFLDLQKAEAQAMEAKIETALEKVRSRTMGMQKSDELSDVANVLFQEMNGLVRNLWTCGFVLCEKDRTEDEWWLSLEDGFSRGFLLPNVNDYAHATLYEGWLEGEPFRAVQLDGEKLQAHYDWLMEVPVAKSIFDEMEAAGMQRPEWQKLHAAYFSKGYLVIITREPCPEQAIFKRFAQVFDLTYTRFLDLQKAEAQAREAQIENALEKVRSRTMGMQESDELADVAFVLFEQLRNLGGNLWGTGFGLCEKGSDRDSFWFANENGVFPPVSIPNTTDPAHQQMYEGWKARKDFLAIEASGKDLESHYNYMLSLKDVKPFFQKILDEGLSFPEWQQWNAAYFKYGYLLIITLEPYPDPDILKRFAKVFDQTYTRFLDLQKAEAQAREAQIENALEKVRSRSLAMQSPDELIEVAELLREEMGALGVEELETSSIYIHDDSSNLTQCWFTIKDVDNPDKSVTDRMIIDLKDTWVGQQMFDFYHSDAKQTSIRMMGEQRIEWIGYCGEKSNLFTPDGFYGDSIPERTYHLYKFSNGYIGAASPGEISDESWDLLRRATSVFSFAYTRFLDLKKAQEQTREAQIELSMERIRAQVTGMQESSDLLDIVVSMRSEFVKLGHEAHYFWHMHWLPKTYSKAMTSGDGTKIGMVMTLPRHIHGDIPLVAEWEKTEEPTVVHAMDAETAVDYVHKMITLGDFERVDPQAPTLDDIRHIGGLTFVMARTTHGEIGFSLPGVVPEPSKDAVDTLVRFAVVFDLAYKRFEDLKTAEKDLIEIKAAWLKAEEALTELQNTQKQLIQSEKLASLGQLTAGIAHEIKNPLNFVNNFSELGLEYIDEIREALAKLDNNETTTEISGLLTDVEENLKMVHQHGTRADNIVKSMLMHSRGGTGKLEPTDLNALIREYVNLAFHGMRAGKEPINVKIDYDLDETLKQVDLNPEDFSRVILNLCKNAFDAMRTRTLSEPNYKPNLKISTKKTGAGFVSIAVEDNGPGIPEHIKDKLFQPFFTTKKGTDGTGLGLSISHDIIQKNNGNITISSEENVSTRFEINLPIESKN